MRRNEKGLPLAVLFVRFAHNFGLRSVKMLEKQWYFLKTLTFYNNQREKGG
ncbi:MAG: hypothetical protein J6J43_02560 [Oscillospiraceae bacterium]|nr:hypothetical protein [Oscillospiraceae bacterium]